MKLDNSVRACVRACVCGGGQYLSILCCNWRLPAVTPGQLLHVSNSWLKPFVCILGGS